MPSWTRGSLFAALNAAGFAALLVLGAGPALADPDPAPGDPGAVAAPADPPGPPPLVAPPPPPPGDPLAPPPNPLAPARPTAKDIEEHTHRPRHSPAPQRHA